MKRLRWTNKLALNLSTAVNESGLKDSETGEPEAVSESVDIVVEVQRFTDVVITPKDGQFECWIKKTLAGRRQQAEVVIRLVDRDEARQFNLQYRQKDYATNVLSFPAEVPDGIPADVAGSVLGDLLICAPVVADEADLQGKQVLDHWAHLTVHGVLHLLGHDHEHESEAARMEALEIEILNDLGISDPYDGN